MMLSIDHPYLDCKYQRHAWFHFQFSNCFHLVSIDCRFRLSSIKEVTDERENCGINKSQLYWENVSEFFVPVKSLLLHLCYKCRNYSLLKFISFSWFQQNKFYRPLNSDSNRITFVLIEEMFILVSHQTKYNTILLLFEDTSVLREFQEGSPSVTINIFSHWSVKLSLSKMIVLG